MQGLGSDVISFLETSSNNDYLTFVDEIFIARQPLDIKVATSGLHEHGPSGRYKYSSSLEHP